jgi:neuropeptide Y receptor
MNSTLGANESKGEFLNNSFVLDKLTDFSDYQFPTAFVTSVIVIYVLLFLVSLLGNGFLCVIIGFRFVKPTVTNLFIGNLAACDVLVTLCIPFTVLSKLVLMYWPFGTFLCPVISVFQLMTILLRALTLVAMISDRYYVLSRPLRQRLNRKQARGIIAGIWSFCLICCLPVAIFSKIIYMPYESGSKGLCVEDWPDTPFHFIYGVIIVLLQYFIPLLVMLWSNSHIAVIVWKNRAPGEANNERDKRRKRSKMKVSQLRTYNMSPTFSLKTIFQPPLFEEF